MKEVPMSDMLQPPKDADANRLLVRSDKVREEARVILENGERRSDKAKTLIRRSEDICRMASEVIRSMPERPQ